MQFGQPTFMGRNGHTTVIAHREFVADVVCSTAFSVVYSSKVNPGLENVFPWLGTFARKFESYRFRRLTFSYEPMVATSQPGNIYLAFDYDSLDRDPANKMELTSYSGCIKSQAWAPCRITADSRDLEKMVRERYTRGPSMPANADGKTYDACKVIVASFGGNGNATGEVYVDYEVELITPQVDVDSFLDESVAITAGGSIGKTAPFGDAPTLSGYLPVTAKDKRLTLKEAGEYLVTFNYGGIALVADQTPSVTPSNGAEASPWITSKVNGTSTYGSAATKVKTSVPDAFVEFDLTNLAGTIGTLRAAVAPFAYTIV
jgi:hypothetical protein